MLAVAAAFADGVTEIRDAAELVVKESNRIGTLQQELTQLGIAVEPRPDGLVDPRRAPAAGAAEEPRRPPHRDGGGGRRERASTASRPCGAGRRSASSYPGFAADLAALTGVAMTADAAIDRVVAIDGPSGSGKSTVARAVADALGLAVLDTGAMYRAVTLAVLEAGADLDDAAACAGIARGRRHRVEDGVTALDGRDVSAEIRGPEVTAAVSTVSAHPAVRAVLVARQREWVARPRRRRGRGSRHRHGRVPGRAGEGVPRRRRRGTGPPAPARRGRGRPRRSRSTRCRPRSTGASASTRSRAASPLRAADDALVIDTTGATSMTSSPRSSSASEPAERTR